MWGNEKTIRESVNFHLKLPAIPPQVNFPGKRARRIGWDVGGVTSDVQMDVFVSVDVISKVSQKGDFDEKSQFSRWVVWIVEK